MQRKLFEDKQQQDEEASKDPTNSQKKINDLVGKFENFARDIIPVNKTYGERVNLLDSIDTHLRTQSVRSYSIKL